MKPMLKYRGGKSKEIPMITPYIPDYTGRYIEPFLGGGALYFHLEPEQSIINDVNTKLFTFYKGVKNDYDVIKNELKNLEKEYVSNRSKFDTLKTLTPNERVHDDNEELYYYIRSLFNDPEQTKYHPATIYYFINKLSYSGMIRYNKKGEFNVPYGRYKNFNTDLVNENHKKLLQRTEILNTDYTDVFKLANENDFIFLDPPYDTQFSDYGNIETVDGFTEDMHVKLASDFKQLNCKSLMVIGRTPLTYDLYKDYIVHEYNKNYAVNIRNRFKAESSHILITNY
ncbi:DNA adenine methylase [Aerococcus viridans]